jgi:hypothetical protein
MTTTLGECLEITPNDIKLAEELVKQHGQPGYYGLTLLVDGQPTDYDDNIMS